MADTIISSTVHVLLKKAIAVATDRVLFEFGFKKDLETLRKSATMIQAHLADAEEKQTKNPAVQLWLESVEKVAFDADNVLDDLNYEILRQKVKSMNQSKLGKVCFFFSLSKHDIAFRLRMGSKVRDINQKLKNFNLEAPGIGLMRIVDSLVPNTTAAPPEAITSRQTNSLVPQFVAGRSKEESEIVEILLSSSDQRDVSVLPVVGMGGLGKTTLAKSVYNHHQIQTHFNKKIWICVSERFEVTQLFRLMLESLKGEKVDMCGQDAIVQQIRTLLHGERFLIVLDDVWNQDAGPWHDFFGSLLGLNTTNGSCCLLTTRLHTTSACVYH